MSITISFLFFFFQFICFLVYFFFYNISHEELSSLTPGRAPLPSKHENIDLLPEFVDSEE